MYSSACVFFPPFSCTVPFPLLTPLRRIFSSIPSVKRNAPRPEQGSPLLSIPSHLQQPPSCHPFCGLSAPTLLLAPMGTRRGGAGGGHSPLTPPRLFRGCQYLSVSAPKSLQAEGGRECPNPLFLCLFLQIPLCNKFPPVLCWGVPCATGVTSPISFPQHSLVPRDGNGDGFSKATLEQDGVMHSLRSHPAPWDPFGGVGYRDPTRASSNCPPSKCLLSAKRHRSGIRFKRRGKAGLWTAVKC